MNQIATGEGIATFAKHLRMLTYIQGRLESSVATVEAEVNRTCDGDGALPYHILCRDEMDIRT